MKTADASIKFLADEFFTFTRPEDQVNLAYQQICIQSHVINVK